MQVFLPLLLFWMLFCTTDATLGPFPFLAPMSGALAAKKSRGQATATPPGQEPEPRALISVLTAAPCRSRDVSGAPRMAGNPERPVELSKLLGRYCGYDTHDNIETASNLLWMRLVSDSSINKATASFSVTFKVTTEAASLGGKGALNWDLLWIMR